MPSSNNVRKVTSENYPTDAGREGELIFRLVYQQAGCKKPFSRLWLSSMEESAIREGFAHLKPSTEYDALYNAALCRERADWMVGINASRLFSCLYGQPLAVGRVMTPVLAMTVVREAAIAAFVPEKFYTVALTLADGGTASSKRFAQKADAELLLSKCRKEGRATVQKMERKEKSESPPQLYDLTALQRDANRLLGFTAQQTLDYAQSLYEKRLITYPRTDSRFLTEDMAASLPGLVTDTGKVFAVEESLPIHVQQVINGGKVTDHHALLPTKSMANADLAALPAGERNVLRLISARLLCAVGEPHRYAETTLTTICAEEEFFAKGKVVLSDGWKAMERKMLGELLGKQKEAVVLPDAQEQSQCSVADAELKEGQTSPPKHFTEDLLLHAMETASADSMPEGVERQGIGTPATRAATIEKLVQKGFLERKGTKKTKVLLPTDKGKALITVMPEEIQSADMTADWEAKLLQIERGEMEPSEFMTEINTMITELVKNTEMKKGVNDDIRTKLLNAGVPEQEIEFIHNADTENKKAELFSKVRSGQVRVLLGSTAKMGAGTNVQTLLVAVHHLDVGWRPSDMTQRNGRIIRQGNQNKQVYVYNYVTESTFDAYLYQTLENKQKFISQIMTSKSPMRSCDDIDEQALSYAEIKALCAGDPRIREKMDLDVQVAKLKVLRGDFQNQKYRLEDKLLKTFPEEIQKQKTRIAALQQDSQIAAAHPQDKENFCGMTIKGMVYDDKKAVGERLLLARQEMPNADMMLLGTYRGFELNIRFDSFKNEHQAVLRAELSYPVSLGDDARGNITRLDNAIDNFTDRIADAENALQNLEQQKQAAEVEVAKPFAQEEELAEKSARLAELNALLNIDRDRSSSQDAPEETEETETPATRPSVLAALGEKTNQSEPVKPFRSYYDKDGDAR